MHKSSIISILILFMSFAFPQFTEVEVSIDGSRLRGESEKYLLTSLEEQIRAHLMNTRFIAEADEIEMFIQFRIVVEGIVEQGNDRVVKVQAVVTNNMDQQFFAKGVDFPFSEGQSITTNTVYDPLSAFVNFYAYMIIAGDLDTYYILGGESQYNSAIEIANQGQSSLYSRGWDTRWKNANQIKENVYIREAKLHYYSALDVLFKQKFKMKELKDPLMKFHEKVMDSAEHIGNDRFTTVFLTAHADQIGEMMQIADMKKELRQLMDFDLDNKDIYKIYLSD